VRQSWYDPLGWAGLDKVGPPTDLPGELDARLDCVEAERHALEGEIQAKRAALRALALEVEALRETGYMSAALKKKEKQLEVDQKELQGLGASHNDACEAHKALTAYRARIASGDDGNPAAHIRHSHHPEPSPSSQYRAVEVWAAISGALTILALLFVFLWRPPHWLWLSVVVILIMAGVEAATGRRLTKYLVTVTVFLAFLTSAIVIVQFWQAIAFLAVAAVVLYVIIDNLRELGKG
jgi:hypothetical protein